jgi:hypothetical protein
VKITSVTANNRKKAFEAHTRRGAFTYPYAKLDVAPSPDDRIVTVYVDKELGREAFTYQLESGREDSIHIDRVLEQNQDARYMTDLLLYRLTVEANERLNGSSMTVRGLARQLHTSPAQIYRLLDTTNYRKSVRQMLDLLYHLDCEVELVVRPRAAV